MRMAIEPACPTPVWEIAAAYAAQSAAALINDPARPLQTLEFLDVMVAPRGTRFSKTQLNNMAGVGLSTQAISPNGRMMIVRETTSYQQNLNGAADNAYTDFTTLATLWTMFERQHQVITSKYPRHKLADDGTRFGPGQAIITPRAIKGELVAQYAADEFLGLTENARAFAKNLIVERDADNPTRINVLYPPDLVNGLRIFAVLAQFRLQYSAQDIAA
jgi:phage tail sheath gpL-like